MPQEAQGHWHWLGLTFSKAQKHKWFVTSSTRGHLEIDRIKRTIARSCGISLIRLPCVALLGGLLPVPNQHRHLDAHRRSRCQPGHAMPRSRSKSPSLIYFAAQPLCCSSQFIKFYCITINMQNSYLKGIQKYNQKREWKTLSEKEGEKLNPLLSVERHVGSGF